MKTSLLIFGTKNFNNSLNEVKEDFNFRFIYFDVQKFSESVVASVSAVIVENKICEDEVILSFINKISTKPILLLEKKNLPTKCKYNEKISLPIGFSELKSKILNLTISYKFKENSSIIIKDYILDKNEKKLKSKNLFITITEREAQLIELLSNENKSLSKNAILKKIWKYADDADTHTVETHIYRLRKKILNKFKDENFIKSLKSGYSL